MAGEGNGEDIADLLHRILETYPTAQIGNQRQNSEMWELVETELPAKIRSHLPAGAFDVRGSAGHNLISAIPWVAIRDTRESKSIEEGVYIIYLFEPQEGRVFLTVNQGISTLRGELGPEEAQNELETRATRIRKQINPEDFSPEPLEFQYAPEGDQLYGPGTIVYKEYSQAELFQSPDCVDDLQQIVETYRQIIDQPLPSSHLQSEPEPPQGDEILGQLQSKGQVVLHGPPGTGKTHTARQFAQWWLTDATAAPTTDQLRVVTFHPSYSYEDFLEGLTATQADDGSVTYEMDDGIFKRICRDAERAYHNTPDTQTPPAYILLIDEINRGNLAKIFGETITLLEQDKRLGGSAEMAVELAHSGDRFVIPPNLYLIGTMNTADRSIALVDAALRRRFSFLSFPPDYEVLMDAYEIRGDSANQTADAVSVTGLLRSSIRAMRAINRSILESGELSKGKQVGHSYLLGIETPADVVRAWRFDILPLLEEYYFGELRRLQQSLFETEEFELYNQDTHEIRSFDAAELQQALDRFLERTTHQSTIS